MPDEDADTWRRADCEAAWREWSSWTPNGPPMADPSQHQAFVDACVANYEHNGIVP